MIDIEPGLSIPEAELRFTYSRSSGPGGQHVNKTSTRVTLLFDVDRSPSLDDHQRRRIRSRLATRVSAEGILRVSAQQSRSREANTEAAIRRFAELLAAALHRNAPRTPTRTTRAAKERRISEKKARARIKQVRGRPANDD